VDAFVRERKNRSFDVEHMHLVRLSREFSCELAAHLQSTSPNVGVNALSNSKISAGSGTKIDYAIQVSKLGQKFFYDVWSVRLIVIDIPGKGMVSTLLAKKRRTPLILHRGIY